MWFDFHSVVQGHLNLKRTSEHYAQSALDRGSAWLSSRSPGVARCATTASLKTHLRLYIMSTQNQPSPHTSVAHMAAAASPGRLMAPEQLHSIVALHLRMGRSCTQHPVGCNKSSCVRLCSGHPSCKRLLQRASGLFRVLLDQRLQRRRRRAHQLLLLLAVLCGEKGSVWVEFIKGVRSPRLWCHSKSCVSSTASFAATHDGRPARQSNSTGPNAQCKCPLQSSVCTCSDSGCQSKWTAGDAPGRPGRWASRSRQPQLPLPARQHEAWV